MSTQQTIDALTPGAKTLNERGGHQVDVELRCDSTQPRKAPAALPLRIDDGFRDGGKHSAMDDLQHDGKRMMSPVRR